VECVTETPQLTTDLRVSGAWLAGTVVDGGVVDLPVGPARAGYDQGHIPGARFLPVSEIVVERDGNINELPPVAHLDSVFESLGISDDTRVVIYGPPLSAARTFFTLDFLGHGDRTALLNGGLEGWKAARRPLSTEEPRVARTTFTPRPQPERVVDAEWVERHLHDPRVALLDARPEDQFTGAVAGEGIPRPGHIPGAGNLYWEELIVSTEHPALEDPERLRELFHEAGVRPGDTVVTYCRTGVQASFAYFVSRYLGYETRMYDGSFMDWSPREELPVER
jgi:thiosulfate/3-mercaptopyruvate sulfurtransferase